MLLVPILFISIGVSCRPSSLNTLVQLACTCRFIKFNLGCGSLSILIDLESLSIPQGVGRNRSDFFWILTNWKLLCPISSATGCLSSLTFIVFQFLHNFFKFLFFSGQSVLKLLLFIVSFGINCTHLSHIPLLLK